MIYFDNSATSFPKPREVMENTFEFISRNCANPGRSVHKMGVDSSRQVFECRAEIANLFNIKDLNRIAFTKNCSEAINIGLFSNINTNDHIITSCLEHNSIVRALEYLKNTKNIEITYIKPNEDLVVTKSMVKEHIRANTKMIAINHANNLVGTYNDIKGIGKLAKENGIIFLLDSAQSAGKKQIDVQEMNINILCAPGHKSLYGFTGIGFVYADENVKIKPMIYGGTGSFSDDINQPQIMPDKLEAGTLNLVGIKSLLEGIKWIKSIGIEKINEKEKQLTDYMLNYLLKIDEVTVYTPQNDELAGIVSFNIKGMDSSYLAGVLDRKYDIAARSGLHCNPFGHEHLGTLESGFVRLSFSYFNDKNEIDVCIKAIKEIIKDK